jgi:hypothetical protein
MEILLLNQALNCERAYQKKAEGLKEDALRIVQINLAVSERR